MKSRQIPKILTIGIFALLTLAGCGGGSEETSSDNGSSVDSYTGAASVGDMAEFSVNGNTLSYNLSGAHFGTSSGSMSITPVSGTTAFHYGTVSSQTIGMMLAGNFGIAIVPNVPDLLNPGNTVNAFVTGLKNATNVEADVMGRTFLYFSQQTTAETFVLKLENDNSFKVQRVPDYLNDLNNAGTLNGEPGTTNLITGCWRASNNGNYLNAVQSTIDLSVASAVAAGSCNQFDFAASGYDTNPASTATGYYRFMIKPGLNRAGLIVDMADGSGFGIGVETTLESSTPVVSAPPGNETYSSFSAPNVTSINLATLFNITTGDSPFTEVVVKPNLLLETTALTCDYTSNPISCMPDTSSGTTPMDTAYDMFCYPDPNNPGDFLIAALPGMTCTFENTLSNPSRIYNALLDNEDGYFFAMSLLGPEFVMGAK